MLKFQDDTVVDPRETEWFEFYTPGQAKVMQPLRESQLYQEDWLGLKQMDSMGKLVFLETPGNHLQVTEKFFVENITKPYLM